MKSLYHIFFLLLLSACSGGQSPRPVPEQKEYSRDIRGEAPSQISTSADEIAEPLEITPADVTFRTVSIADPFDPDTALRRLYPGAFQENSFPDRANYVLWKCPGCDPSVFPGWLPEEPRYFPDPQGMETEVARSFRYTEQGKELAAVFFSSHEIRYGEPGSGRFFCAVMGAALFEKRNERWELVAFHPGNDCTGTYGEARTPDTLRLNGKMKFILEDVNGGAGAPYIGRYTLYDFGKQTFRKLLTVPEGSLGNYRHQWLTTFNFIQGETGEPVIVAATTGTYDEQTASDLADYNLGGPFGDIFGQKEYNSFVITRTYRYRGSEYKLEKQATDLSFKKL